MRWTRAILLTLVVSISADSAPARALSFSGLGFLPGASESGAANVSADGTTVVGTSGVEAFRWTQPTGVQGLGVLSGSGTSSAASVSADGSVVVGSSNGEAFRWTTGGGMTGLAVDLPPSDQSSATGVSADGSVVVGGFGIATTFAPFRWEGGSASDLGLGVSLPEVAGGTGVSSDGSLVLGFSGIFDDPNPFQWTAADGVTFLDELPFQGLCQCGTSPVRISADGSTMVGVSEGEAVLWTAPNAITGLGFLTGSPSFNGGSAAHDVSGDGSVVVGTSEDAPGVFEAFLWGAGSGMLDLRDFLVASGLDLTGWTLESATGISDDGQTIVGVGTNPDGFSEAWIVVIPEPSTVFLLGAGLTLLARRRAR